MSRVGQSHFDGSQWESMNGPVEYRWWNNLTGRQCAQKETCPSVTFSTTNLTFPDMGSNPGLDRAPELWHILNKWRNNGIPLCAISPFSCYFLSGPHIHIVTVFYRKRMKEENTCTARMYLSSMWPERNLPSQTSGLCVRLEQGQKITFVCLSVRPLGNNSVASGQIL